MGATPDAGVIAGAGIEALEAHVLAVGREAAKVIHAQRRRRAEIARFVMDPEFGIRTGSRARNCSADKSARRWRWRCASGSEAGNTAVRSRVEIGRGRARKARRSATCRAHSPASARPTCKRGSSRTLKSFGLLLQAQAKRSCRLPLLTEHRTTNTLTLDPAMHETCLGPREQRKEVFTCDQGRDFKGRC